MMKTQILKNGEILRRKGLHFVHTNTNSLLPQMDELRHLTKYTDASVVGISETKLDNSISSSEI